MIIRLCLLIVLIIVIPITLCASNSKLYKHESCPNMKTTLGSVRKRRHLAFPPGAAVGLTMSGVKTIMTHVPSGWYSVVEAELIFKLPDAEFVSKHTRRKLHHRQKKEAWELLQEAFERQNMNGRACILKTICETKYHLAPKGKSLVHDIVRSIFTTHLQEEYFIKEIQASHDELLDSTFCEKPNDCPFSFLSFILELNKQI